MAKQRRVDMSSTDFYRVDAAEVYTGGCDFTVVESPAPLSSATKNKLRLAISRTLTTAVFAAITGIVTISAAGALPFGTSATNIVMTEETPSPPNIVEMTALMQKRATLADVIFRHVAHPDEDDVEPDYGF
jgi:hypothetical protein